MFWNELESELVTHLAMLPLHMGDVDLFLGKQSVTLAARPARVSGLLGEGGCAASFQKGLGLLFTLLHPIYCVDLLVGALGHRISGLRCEGQVYSQVRGTFNGLKSTVHRLGEKERKTYK